jgi:predicted dehydrogenase
VKASGVPLRAGIIGMGKMGQIRAKVIEEFQGIKLCAVADFRSETLSQYSNVACFKDGLELLDQDLDIVFICAYNNSLASLAVAALERGLHVFAEKPPGRSVDDVKQIIEAHKRFPECKIKFGFNHRYHYSVIEAKSMIESGKFGEILWLRGVYGKAGGIQFENNWRSDKTKAGGGILLDQGIHMLDLLRYFVGDFNQVKSMITTSFWNIPVEDNAFVLLRTPKNQIAFIHSSSTQWKHKFSIEISLQDGYINLNGILTESRSYGDEMLNFARKQFEDTSFAFGKPREETIYFDRNDSWHIEVKEFIDAVNDNKPIINGSLDDALAIMELLEKIYRSSENE